MTMTLTMTMQEKQDKNPSLSFSRSKFVCQLEKQPCYLKVPYRCKGNGLDKCMYIVCVQDVQFC